MGIMRGIWYRYQETDITNTDIVSLDFSLHVLQAKNQISEVLRLGNDELK